MLPVQVTGSYELEVRFARTAGWDSVVVILPVGSAQPSLILASMANQFHGLECINGKGCTANETTVKPGALKNNHIYALDMRVVLAKDSAQIHATLDGSPLISWQGPVSALSTGWKIPMRNAVGLGSWGGTVVVFHSVRLRMLSGTARVLRAPR